MEQTIRRWGAGLAALVLCLGLLSGCGQTVPAKTGEDTGAQTEAETGQAGDPLPSDPAPEGETDPGPAPEQAETAGTPVDALPADLPEEMTFSSGAGAWRTVLSLLPDGSFTGQYSDWDSGGDPSIYPEGVYYICNFTGTFQNLRQLDDTAYAMTLETLTARETEGAEWTEGDTLYIGAAPYGLEGGAEFLLYTPEASTDVLTTEALQAAWPEWNLPETVPEGQLGCWMLYNPDMDQAFFSYE